MPGPDLQAAAAAAAARYQSLLLHAIFSSAAFFTYRRPQYLQVCRRGSAEATGGRRGGDEASAGATTRTPQARRRTRRARGARFTHLRVVAVGLVELDPLGWVAGRAAACESRAAAEAACGSETRAASERARGHAFTSSCRAKEGGCTTVDGHAPPSQRAQSPSTGMGGTLSMSSCALLRCFGIDCGRNNHPGGFRQRRRGIHDGANE